MTMNRKSSTFETLSIDDIDYLIIDVETTGLSVEHGDRVCEIGAVKLRGNAVIETYGSLINPQRPISYGAFAVNGITPEMLIDAPVFSQIADKIWNMMDNSVLVAYNAPFDLSFITNEFRLLGYPTIHNTIIDALALARKLLPGLQTYQQGNVAKVIGIQFPVKHRALEDAMTTTQIFMIFASILKAHDCALVKDFWRNDIMYVLHKRRMDIITNALSNTKNLWIKYLSPTNAEITDRIITPKECFIENVGMKKTTYLNAYCHSTKAERSFRLDRILDLRVI